MTLIDFKFSLYHRINTIILPDGGFLGSVTGETLELTDVDSNTYSFNNKNIAYANPSGIADSSLVKIYDNEVLLDQSDYSINYLNNTVVLRYATEGNITADYSYYPVTVMDAFPDHEDFEHANLPIVAVEIHTQEPFPFDIGTISSNWKIQFYIDVFAPNDIVKMSLTDCIQKNLARYRIDLVDFSELPLNYDGTINSSFDFINQKITYIHPVRTRAVPVNMGAISKKEKYRCSISGVMEHIH